MLTPELNLNNTYQLTFDWKASPAFVNNNKSYTLKVYAVDTQSGNETLLLDIADPESRKASGVTSFKTWEQHHSKLDLSPFQGKKIRIAFVYDLLKKTGNSLWIDNVKVEQGAPVTAPVAQSSLMQYQFQKMYIGEKHYTEAFTLKNIGAKGLKVTGFEAPEGVTLNADTAHINLDVNETARMQLAYKASLTSPTSGNAVIKTNGGNITIPYTAVKEAVPGTEEYKHATAELEGILLTDENKAGKPRPRSERKIDDDAIVSPNGAWTWQSKGSAIRVSEDGTWDQKDSAETGREGSSQLFADGSWESKMKMGDGENFVHVNPDGSWTSKDSFRTVEVKADGTWRTQTEYDTKYSTSDGKVFRESSGRKTELPSGEHEVSHIQVPHEPRLSYLEDGPGGGGVIPLTPRKPLQPGQQAVS